MDGKKEDANVQLLQHPKQGNTKQGRCGQCLGCKAPDCAICKFCRDKKKFGGPGKLKKCCVNRHCTRNPSTNLPNKPVQPGRLQPDITNLLLQQKRKIRPISGDGNCFFRSLSFFLFNTEDNHLQVQR